MQLYYSDAKKKKTLYKKENYDFILKRNNIKLFRTSFFFASFSLRDKVSYEQLAPYQSFYGQNTMRLMT